MNYQTTGSFIYSGRLFLAVLLALGLSFFGVSALLFYLFAVGLVFPVVVSMDLHRKKESGKIRVPDNREEWMVYVNGIPVRETRNTLANPAFMSQAALRRYFIVLFSVRIVLQVIACVMLAAQGAGVQHWGIWLALAAAGGLMLYGLSRSCLCLQALLSAGWVVERLEDGGRAEGFRGGFIRRGKFDDALSRGIGLF